MAAVDGADLLGAGHDALARGAWAEARTRFEEAAAAAGDAPEAWEGVSRAAWWLGDEEVTLTSRERSYRGYQRAADARGAARMAAWLGMDHLDFRGDDALAVAWLRRAGQLVESEAPCAEQGWVALMQAEIALLADCDFPAAQALSERALVLAHSLGDRELEIVGDRHGGLRARRRRGGGGRRAPVRRSGGPRRRHRLQGRARARVGPLSHGLVRRRRRRFPSGVAVVRCAPHAGDIVVGPPLLRRLPHGLRNGADRARRLADGRRGADDRARGHARVAARTGGRDRRSARSAARPSGRRRGSAGRSSSPRCRPRRQSSRSASSTSRPATRKQRPRPRSACCGAGSA